MNYGLLPTIFWLALIAATAAAMSPARAAETTADGFEFFEKKIRPVLSETCFKCHSAQSEKLKGGLLLDTREGLLKGGDTGPAIVPGEPEKSLLVKAIGYQDADLQMPPKQKLTDRQIADFTAWIRMGAPWPTNEKASAQRAQKAALEISEKDRAWWAFQPIRRPATPIANRQSDRKSQIANRKSD